MNPHCKKCEKTESILWRKDAENGEICNECYESEKSEQKIEQENAAIAAVEAEKETKEKETAATVKETTVIPEAKIRKSTRSTRFKNKAVTRQKSSGKTSRRSNTFKSSRPQKTPTNICAETKTKTHVFHDGFYYQVGDIVSVMCRGKKYFAQIRALIVDTFCEKSAGKNLSTPSCNEIDKIHILVLSWLIPTTSSPDPNEEFDASTYLLGLEEDIPRRINTMEFVMHAPSTYFISRTEPYAKPEELSDGLYAKNKRGFVWTSV
jgi:GATA zinc finger domain-containing protein 1